MPVPILIRAFAVDFSVFFIAENRIEQPMCAAKALATCQINHFEIIKSRRYEKIDRADAKNYNPSNVKCYKQKAIIFILTLAKKTPG